jgi:phosphocarrier protein
MVEGETKVHNFYGIHARPSSIIVKEAIKFKSEIKVNAKSGEAPADEVLSLMSLGIEHGDVVRITAEGEDEQAALAKMLELFHHNFDFKRDE